MIEIKNHNEFFKLQKSFSHVPFTQSEAWHNMLRAKKSTMRFFVDSDEKTSLALWGIVIKIPLFGKSLFRILGESYNGILDEKQVKSSYEKLALIFDAIEIDSNNKYNIDFEIGLRRAGFKRPLVSFSCPLTLENNLVNEQLRSRNWKRNVKIAEKKGLTCKLVDNIDDAVIEEFVSFFNEMATTKGMTNTIKHNEIKALVLDNCFKLFVVLTPNNKSLAYRIVNINDDYAYDIFAANSNESRNYRGSSHLLIEAIFKFLKDEGIKYFDFGRIPPSNHDTDKIYEFKIAARGNKIQYNGEWTFYKSQLIEFLMLLFKMFKLRKQRY